MPSMSEQRNSAMAKWEEDNNGNLSRKQSGKIPYTVQKGDTWNQIALDKGVPLDEMDFLNPNVSDHGKIKPGQILVVGTTDPESIANPTDADRRELQDPSGLNWKANPDAPVKSRVRKALGKFDKE